MNRLPSLFVSHGAPTFAIEPGRAAGRGRRHRPQAGRHAARADLNHASPHTDIMSYDRSPAE